MNYYTEIDAAVSSDGPLSRSDVERWIEATADLATLAKLYKITGEGYYRIKPELGKELECTAVRNYLLECMRRDLRDDDSIESRYEAAATLHGWLRQLLDAADCDAVIRTTASSITDLFLLSGEDIRDAIETGFLECAGERWLEAIL
jgi:hypothetical protein